MWLIQEIDEIKACLEEGMTDREIGDWIGAEQSAIWQFRRKHGLQPDKINRYWSRFNLRHGEYTLESILTMRQEGMSLSKIGKLLDLHHFTVKQAVDKCEALGITIDKLT